MLTRDHPLPARRGVSRRAVRSSSTYRVWPSTQPKAIASSTKSSYRSQGPRPFFQVTSQMPGEVAWLASSQACHCSTESMGTCSYDEDMRCGPVRSVGAAQLLQRVPVDPVVHPLVQVLRAERAVEAEGRLVPRSTHHSTRL